MHAASLLGHSSGQLVTSPACIQEEERCHQLAAGSRACIQGRGECRWSALETTEHACEQGRDECSWSALEATEHGTEKVRVSGQSSAGDQA